jgi:RHS repeat-associated protein
VYDGENRLVLVEPLSASSGAVRVRMAYDYLGRRVQKVVEEHDGSGWDESDDVRWVYAGWNKIEERRTSGGVTTKKDFVWGLDLSQSMAGAGGIGGLLAVVDESGTQMSFLYDANGNVGQLVDEQGATVARYEYDAFGNVLVASGAAAEENAYRFSTKYADAETGLEYYGLRMYSPTLGRWLNRDPAEEDVGGANLYGMVGNAPNGFVDALGLKRLHLYLVVKSFIAPIVGETGFIPSGAATSGRIPSTDGALIAGALFGLNEDPRDDSKDGAYRLYSRLDVYFDCCGEGNDRFGSGLSSHMDKDGGGEALFGLIAGTMEIRDMRIRKRDSQTWEFRYRGTGRPNLLAEPAFNIFSPRTSRFIWHEVLGTFSCKDNVMKAEMVGSNFPSHRMWIGGELAAEDSQGLLINLWRPSENDPSQVRGDRHLF